jgi:hypothetical protein
MKKLISVFMVLLLVLSVSVFAVSAEEGTTANFRYDTKFFAAKLFYNDLSLIADEYCAIPGLENTNVAGKNCSAMTPQGLCVTEDYIFISAYCAAEKYIKELKENKDYGINSEKLEAEKNHKTHNSVIYIIDRKTGEYIKNIVLPDTNHVGGLATDGSAIFIAKSSDEQISVITLKSIKKALDTKSLSVKVKYDYTVDCGCTASFVTYYDNSLWVGIFNEDSNGMLKRFSVNQKNYKLTEKSSIEIPAKANGACFTEINGEVCLAISTSYGRKSVSQLYLCGVSDYGTKNMTVTEKGRYILPPLAQNICIYDGRVYSIYESAATCYSQVEAEMDLKSTTCIIDRVCIGEVERLFNWHCEENTLVIRLNSIIEGFKALITALIG